MTEDERDRVVAAAIKDGACPFGMLREGQGMGHCPLGFPGCECAEELMSNPYLQEDVPPEAVFIAEDAARLSRPSGTA